MCRFVCSFVRAQGSSATNEHRARTRTCPGFDSIATAAGRGRGHLPPAHTTPHPHHRPDCEPPADPAAPAAAAASADARASACATCAAAARRACTAAAVIWLPALDPCAPMAACELGIATGRAALGCLQEARWMGERFVSQVGGAKGCSRSRLPTTQGVVLANQTNHPSPTPKGAAVTASLIWMASPRIHGRGLGHPPRRATTPSTVEQALIRVHTRILRQEGTRGSSTEAAGPRAMVRRRLPLVPLLLVAAASRCVPSRAPPPIAVDRVLSSTHSTRTSPQPRQQPPSLVVVVVVNLRLSTPGTAKSPSAACRVCPQCRHGWQLPTAGQARRGRHHLSPVRGHWIEQMQIANDAHCQPTTLTPIPHKHQQGRPRRHTAHPAVHAGGANEPALLAAVQLLDCRAGRRRALRLWAGPSSAGSAGCV